MMDAHTERCKNSAVQFLRLVTSGHIEEAYQKFVDMNGKHHNCYFPAGLETLRSAMIDNHKQFPTKIFDIKNVIADGTMVAVHSHLRFKEGEPGMVTVQRRGTEIPEGVLGTKRTLQV